MTLITKLNSIIRVLLVCMFRIFGHAKLSLIVLLMSFSLVSCSTTASTSTGSSVSPLSLGFLHVEHFSNPDVTPIIVDQYGREVSLKGVALSGFEDQSYQGATGTTPHYPTNPSAYNGKCPVNDGKAPDPPVCEVSANQPWNEQSTAFNSQNDLAQVRADGFNVVRLTINWSELEPTPGHYSNTFLDRVSQVVSWAKQQGVSVILDMHEDGYSRFLNYPADSNVKKIPAPSGCSSTNGQDGAPRWATLTNGEPSCALFGQNQLNPALGQALTNFWNNKSIGITGEAPGPGLEDHFIGAVATLARKFQNNSTVAGYELLNEPLPPGSGPIPVDNLFDFSDNYLFPLYQRIIEAITGVRDSLQSCSANNPMGGSSSGKVSCAYPDLGIHTNQLIFVEPSGYRNQAEIGPQLSYSATLPNHLPPPLTEYTNLVYAPHIYTHVFTIDTFAGSSSPPAPGTDSVATFPAEVMGLPTGPVNSYPPSYDFGYATAISEAQALRAALLVTEYGDGPGNDSTILTGMERGQQDSLTSAIFWTWKENCGTNPANECNGSWGVYSPPPSSKTGKLIENGPLRTSRLQIIGGPYLYAVTGTVLASGYDPSTGNFSAQVSVSKSGSVGDLNHETEVYIPSFDKNAQIKVTSLSVAALVSQSIDLPGGAREVIIATSGKGDYVVTVFNYQGATLPSVTEAGGIKTPQLSEQALLLQERVESQVGIPLAPIDEPQARSILTRYINTLVANPSTKVSGTILSGLLNQILGSPSQDPNGS